MVAIYVKLFSVHGIIEVQKLMKYNQNSGKSQPNIKSFNSRKIRNSSRSQRLLKKLLRKNGSVELCKSDEK